MTAAVNVASLGTAMSADSSGNVGIGTSSPTNKLHVSSSSFETIKLQGTSTVSGINFVNSASSNGYIYYDNGPNMLFYTNGSERMRIDSSGTWMLNTTDVDAFIGSSTSQTGFSFRPGLAPRLSLVNDFYINRSNGDGNIFEFRRNGTAVGRITVSSGATSYVTSSDYRLKQDIVPITSALAKVSALNPVTYKWKSDGSSAEGFIAHELAEICPQAVSGEKDAVDAEGNPIHQGIDTSFLVATLTAAIQELKAIVDTQAARITALETP